MGQAKNIKHQHTAALQAAISNLEQFANKNESAPIAHVADLSVKEGKLVSTVSSHLQQTFTMAKCFVAALFSSKARQHHLEKKAQVQEVVLRAIDVVKRNHILIEQLQKGSPEEQKLAASALDAIKRYNAVLDQANTSPGDWSQTIARFFYEHGGLSVDEEVKANRIDLPRAHMIHAESTGHIPNQKISGAFHSHVGVFSAKSHLPEFSAVMLTKMMSDPLSKQETDLLRMKSSTLMKQHGIRFKSMSEALQAIKEAPIHTHYNKETSIALLRLSLTLIPGLVVEVQGAFQRSEQAPQHSVPIADQFGLVFRSLHNGFPHPMQYNGWALGNALIPAYPHRLDQMPVFKPFYLRKQEAAKALLPDGAYFERARDNSQLHALFYADNQRELLKLHHDLCEAILKAAPLNVIPENAADVIEKFFYHLSLHEKPLVYLARTYAAINEHFIERQHLKLQDIWLTRNNNDSAEIAQKARKDLAEDSARILIQFEEEAKLSLDSCEQYALQFAKCMGTVLHGPVQSILMQHYSETFGCPPRMLTDFEQKLQMAAYKQQLTFLDEIEGKSEWNPIDSLKSDIALFQTEVCDTGEADYVNIIHELEVYFNSRYYSAL